MIKEENEEDEKSERKQIEPKSERNQIELQVKKNMLFAQNKTKIMVIRQQKLSEVPYSEYDQSKISNLNSQQGLLKHGHTSVIK